MKNKMRSIRAAQKRILPAAKGRYKRWHSYTSHLAYSKSTKEKRNLKKHVFLTTRELKRLRKVLY